MRKGNYHLNAHAWLFYVIVCNIYQMPMTTLCKK